MRRRVGTVPTPVPLVTRLEAVGFSCCGLQDTCVAYCPARVGNVLGSEHISEGGLPSPSLSDGVFFFYCGSRQLRTGRPLACECDTVATGPRRRWVYMLIRMWPGFLPFDENHI